MRGRAGLPASLLLAAGLVCRATEPPPGVAPGVATPPPSIHQRELEAHRALPAPEGPGYPLLYAVTPQAREEVQAEALTRTVYGFMPYWSVSDLTHVRWDLLSHVAYFCVEMNSDGSIAALHNWPSGTSVTALRNAAHANGVKVTLAATLFSSSAIATLLGSSTNRQNAIDTLLSQAQAGGADGVNIDFEGVPTSQKANLVTFMTDLAGAFHSAIPGSHVSLDTPAVDWSGAFDYDALAAACDGMFIMAYDYHWSSDTQAGPCSPLTGGSVWGTYNVTWTVNDYITYGGSSNKGKFILGLPYYGYEWPTSSTSVPSAATDTGDSVVYNTAKANAASHGRRWDSDSQTPYYVYTSGGAHQGWYDDAQSLGLKWDLVRDQNLGGTGMWALNYDTSDDLLWDQIAAKFTTGAGPLTGKKLCLDPGHGGSDPGAVGPTGLEEEDVNLAVGLFLRDALEAQGASVFMTRTTDADVELQARCDYANSIPADRFESVHHNASGTPSANYTGAHIYSCSASTNTRDMASKTALRLDAALDIGVVSSNCSPSIYGVHADGFWVLVHTNMPAMLTEGSFISNPAEEALLRTDARRCTEAGAVAKGIEDHYGVTAADPPCAGPSVGTCANPIAISSFPYSNANNTVGKGAALNGYSCAPTTNEAGPEIVYQFSVNLAGAFSATVTDGSGVDIDVHLLSACSASSCLARGDTSIGAFLQPGTYFVVCDTWGDGSAQFPGAYTLNATFTPDTTAPAEIQDVKWNRALGRWEWTAVTEDRLGGAETMGTYQVWRATDPASTYTLLANGLTTPYLADASTPPAGVCWFYYVHAVDAAGNRDGPELDWIRTYGQASYAGTWTQGGNADCLGGSGQYRWADAAAAPTATASWSFQPEESGSYTVSVRHVASTVNRTAARFTVGDLAGSSLYSVDQTLDNCTWIPLGSHLLRSGQTYTVVLDNQAALGKVVIAEAARWAKDP